MPETWYVMEDGSVGDPRKIKPGKDGRLVHSDGRKVAYAPHGPRSRSIEPAVVEQKATAAKATAAKKIATEDDDGAGAKGKTKESKPDEAKDGYKTRESKAAE